MPPRRFPRRASLSVAARPPAVSTASDRAATRTEPAALAESIQEAVSAGLDPGTASLDTYGVWRRFDNHLLAGATDVLNRLFSNNIGPIKHLRRLGLHGVDNMGLLRGLFIREAAGLNGKLPVLLQ